MSSPTSPPVEYRWAPLDDKLDIRLLDIDVASDGKEPIKCHLRTATLADIGPFSTLSYVWGDATLSHSVICDGSIIHVTASLHAALLAVRRHFSDASPEAPEVLRMPVWADAVCINQSDNRERSAQVALMGQIYERSRRLMVWLGESSMDDDEAVKQSGRGRILGRRLRERIVDIYRREWFMRRWVIQELLLSVNAAVEFMVGKYLMSLMELVHAGYLYTPPRLLAEFLRLRREIEGHDIEREPKRTLLENLVRYKKQECLDPHDRVYALRSISSDGSEFEVDYSKSYQTLCLELARKYANQGKAGELLVRASCNNRLETRVMPSWVPDWNREAAYLSTRHWKATISVEACDVTDGMWGGHGIADNIVSCGDKLKIQGWILGPCRQNNHDEHPEPSCPQCITTSMLQSFLAQEKWVDQKRVQVCILPPRAEEIDVRGKKTAFLLYPAMGPTEVLENQQCQQIEGADLELASCLKIRLDFHRIAALLGVEGRLREELDQVFSKLLNIV